MFLLSSFCQPFSKNVLCFLTTSWLQPTCCCDNMCGSEIHLKSRVQKISETLLRKWASIQWTIEFLRCTVPNVYLNIVRFVIGKIDRLEYYICFIKNQKFNNLNTPRQLQLQSYLLRLWKRPLISINICLLTG